MRQLFKTIRRIQMDAHPAGPDSAGGATRALLSAMQQGPTYASRIIA
jgi:hypothetical protein